MRVELIVSGIFFIAAVGLYCWVMYQITCGKIEIVQSDEEED